HCDPSDLHSFPTRRSSDLTKDELFVLQDLEDSNLADIHQWEIYPPDRPGEITDMAVWKEELYLVIAERLYRSSQDGQTEEITVRSEEHTSELQSRFDLVCR